MKIKSHDFEINGGEYIENGKPHWPDNLNINIPRYQALKIIEQLSRALQYQDPEKIQLNFMGKLDYDNESRIEI